MLSAVNDLRKARSGNIKVLKSTFILKTLSVHGDSSLSVTKSLFLPSLTHHLYVYS